jgi:hypothetical protein
MPGILQTLFLGAAAAVKDAYFNLVTLLLNTTATNGAQNNTFLDSSTNNFTITRNGNTTQGTFTPFSQTGWGNYFDGTDDDLSIASNANLTPAAGDFTLECWIYPTSWGGSGTFRAIAAGPVSGCMFFGQTSTNFGLRALATGDIVVTSTLPTINTWTHVAASRSGTTARLFINGALAATATDSTNFPQTQFVIANTSVAGTEEYYGYISNLRFVKGTAVYTAAFTPSTTPLTAVSNTQLLTCQSNRFVDNSTNAFSLSIGGTPAVQAFSPFAPTTAYDTAVVGGSGYFDGSGDYLITDASSNLTPASGDFTAECWCYAGAVVNDDCILDITNNTSVGLMLFQRSNNALGVYNRQSSTVIITTANNTLIPNQWQHLVVQRSGSTVTVYIDGVSKGTATDSTNFTGNKIAVASYSEGGGYYTGYVSGVRFLKGTALYSSTFTPPTAPPTAISNTQLLLNMTNGGIFDSTAKNVLETVGNAQVSTTQAKWGTTSMYFDGTGDYLKARLNDPLVFLGSGDWTIEGFVYLNSTSGTQAFIIGQSDYANATNASYSLYVTGSSAGDFFYGSTNVALGAAGLSATTWTHCAWVRNGSTITFYRDGTSITSLTIGTNTINNGTTNPTCVGAANNGTSSLNGYMDDLRITKGYARYTANFTPPTAAFAIQ